MMRIYLIIPVAAVHYNHVYTLRVCSLVCFAMCVRFIERQTTGCSHTSSA